MSETRTTVRKCTVLNAFGNIQQSTVSVQQILLPNRLDFTDVKPQKYLMVTMFCTQGVVSKTE